MTNKNEMPVVGRRYKPTEANEFIGNKNYIVSCDEILSDRVILDKNKDGSYFSFPIKDFFKYFEELPDQPQVNDEVKVNGIEEALKELNHELEYKKTPAIKNFNNGTLWQSCYDDLHIKAQKLVDAIENTDVIKTCPNCKWNYFSLLTDPTKFCSPDCEAESQGVKVPCVGANCEGCNCEKEKPKSIWKDVSELPKSNRSVFVKHAYSNHISFAEFEKTDFTGEGEFITINGSFVRQNITHYFTLTDFLNSFEQLQRDVEEIKGKINKINFATKIDH